MPLGRGQNDLKWKEQKVGGDRATKQTSEFERQGIQGGAASRARLVGADHANGRRLEWFQMQGTKIREVTRP